MYCYKHAQRYADKKDVGRLDRTGEASFTTMLPNAMKCCWLVWVEAEELRKKGGRRDKAPARLQVQMGSLQVHVRTTSRITYFYLYDIG